MAVGDYFLLFAIVLGVNLMPAFGPPTWTIIVLYGLNSHLPLPGLVLIGALAAASGSLFLAYGFRLLAGRLSERTRRNLAAARQAIVERRRGAIIGLALFALSPVPSAQLFEAAGLARVPLVGFTLAFFAGRTVSYTIYGLTARQLTETSLGDAFRSAFTSPVGVAIQLAMIALLVLLTRIDWARRLGLGDESAR
jgi:membrane protein YqaA with SNARE-associated domain